MDASQNAFTDCARTNRNDAVNRRSPVGILIVLLCRTVCSSRVTKDQMIAMSDSTSSRPRRSTSQTRKSSRSGSRPNRSQLRAMEIRSAESGSVAAAPSTTSVAPRPGRARTVSRTIGLSREAEMNYQRNDLRRLLYTAGVLFVLMIVLLIFLD
jgi:hypothetical protein